VTSGTGTEGSLIRSSTTAVEWLRQVPLTQRVRTVTERLPGVVKEVERPDATSSPTEDDGGDGDRDTRRPDPRGDLLNEVPLGCRYLLS
jgi:hypothetical protein